jgi:hypothetical protein
MANSFLNYFFDELENGIDTVMQKRPRIQDTAANMMKVPSEEVASKATNLLKNGVKDVLKEEVNKLNSNFFRKAFGVATAAMVAVSTYAYLV